MSKKEIIPCFINIEEWGSVSEKDKLGNVSERRKGTGRNENNVTVKLS
jgi:hypothetical protein